MIDKIDPKKFVLIKESLKESLEGNTKTEEEDANPKEAITEDDAASEVIVKDAFEIMLESANGGRTTPKMPMKSRRRRIAPKTSTGKKREDIRKWLDKA